MNVQLVVEKDRIEVWVQEVSDEVVLGETLTAVMPTLRAMCVAQRCYLPGEPELRLTVGDGGQIEGSD